MGRCLSIKGAEEHLNKPFAFELTTHDDTMYFIALSGELQLQMPRAPCALAERPPLRPTFSRSGGRSSLRSPLVAPIPPCPADKEKEDWINAVGRAIVRQSSSLCDE